ncbi:tripartite tricarboxylate transporter TctB family protein [Pararhizobium sp. IMCC21322]|uniref:tripartite tricarboxylate transporter TctB family protein n=1 Tax=Pararhizobium sp. IMCC21322 TaxID=3067903 RepID=UPI00274193FA|nr:tripartite tricarboxylate transporter TctB family protein [Pararhizobium sp. IMCC21322]
MQLNRDTAIAIVSLLICGALLISTFQMPDPMFNQMPATLWPRMIIGPLVILSLILLVRAQMADADTSTPIRSLPDWFSYYKNPIICFVLFFLFLVSMPVLGMLIGGLLYVFITLSVLGGWSPQLMLRHGLVSVFFVVGMWAIFTQLLGVFLPEGILLRVY